MISGRAPILPTSCDARAEPSMIVATIGRYAIPDFSGLYPHTFCTKSVRKKNMPNSAVPMHRLIRYAPLRFRDRTTRGGTSADRDRASMMTNATSSTTAATSDTMTLVSPQCETAWPLLNVVAAEDRP